MRSMASLIIGYTIIMKILKYLIIVVAIEFISVTTLVAFGIDVKAGLNYTLNCLQKILNN